MSRPASLLACDKGYGCLFADDTHAFAHKINTFDTLTLKRFLKTRGKDDTKSPVVPDHSGNAVTRSLCDRTSDLVWIYTCVLFIIYV